MNMLARAFRQKAVCVNCGQTHAAHHQHGACPLGDGSGYSLNSHYRRDRQADLIAIAAKSRGVKPEQIVVEE